MKNKNHVYKIEIHVCKNCGRKFGSSFEFGEHASRNAPEVKDNESFEAYCLRVKNRKCKSI